MTMRRAGSLSCQLLRQTPVQARQTPRTSPAARPALRHPRPIALFAHRRHFATPTDPSRPPPPEPKTPQEEETNPPADEPRLPNDLDEKAARASAFGEANPSTVNPPPAIDLLAQAEAHQDSRDRSDRGPDAYKTSIDRRREKVAYYGYLAFPSILLAGLLVLGQNWDDREAKAHPDIPNGWTPSQVYTRAKTRLAETLGYYTEPAFPQLLPDVDPAYKPPYTLVLSLEDLMVHSKWSRQNGWEVAKR